MNLQEAVRSGICRLRRPAWQDGITYIKIDILEGGLAGPWIHLFARHEQKFWSEPTPMDIPWLNDSIQDYEEYKGPLDENDEEISK